MKKPIQQCQSKGGGNQRPPRQVSVAFLLTDDQITDLGIYLQVRQTLVNCQMDTVSIQDRICMAVYKAAKDKKTVARGKRSSQ